MIWSKHYNWYLFGLIAILLLALVSTKNHTNLTDVFHGTFISNESSDISISIDSKDTNTFTLYSTDEYGRQSSEKGTIKQLTSKQYMIDSPVFHKVVIDYENLEFSMVLAGKPVTFKKFHNNPIIILNQN